MYNIQIMDGEDRTAIKDSLIDCPWDSSLLGESLHNAIYLRNVLIDPGVYANNRHLIYIVSFRCWTVVL